MTSSADKLINEIIKLIETDKWENVKKNLTHHKLKLLTLQYRNLEKVNSKLNAAQEVSSYIAKVMKTDTSDVRDKITYWKDLYLEQAEETKEIAEALNRSLEKEKDLKQEITRLRSLI